MARRDSMADTVSGGSVLLTIEGVRALRQERDEVAREHAALTQRLEVLNNKLEAIKLFLPPHLQDELAEDGGSSRKRIWAPIVFQILTDSGQAMTVAEMAAKVREIPSSPDPGYENAALYNGLSKMVRKGELHKQDGYYLLPGQPVNKSPDEFKADQLQIDILAALKAGPLKSPEIIKAILDANAPSASKMVKSTGRFYKVLSHLVRVGLVERDGRLYEVAPQKNEPSDAGTSNGSDAGSGDGRPRTLRLV